MFAQRVAWDDRHERLAEEGKRGKATISYPEDEDIGVIEKREDSSEEGLVQG